MKIFFFHIHAQTNMNNTYHQASYDAASSWVVRVHHSQGRTCTAAVVVVVAVASVVVVVVALALAVAVVWVETTWH